MFNTNIQHCYIIDTTNTWIFSVASMSLWKPSFKTWHPATSFGGFYVPGWTAQSCLTSEPCYDLGRQSGLLIFIYSHHTQRSQNTLKSDHANNDVVKNRAIRITLVFMRQISQQSKQFTHKLEYISLSLHISSHANTWEETRPPPSYQCICMSTICQYALLRQEECSFSLVWSVHKSHAVF